MRVVDVRERAVPISRYGDPALPSGGLDTSAVAVITDVIREGKPVVGYGFSSIGRFAQSGLIRERFAPRLLSEENNLDPAVAWHAMMRSEKMGGHGERCVAVGTLDMAVWDAAAKIAGMPLFRFLAQRVAGDRTPAPNVAVYAGGGYYYPGDDVVRLGDEIRRHLDQGYTHVKIKIGAAPLSQDLGRIEAVLKVLQDGRCLAVDAMNAYDTAQSLTAARGLAPYRLWWFEDICDPLDFETLRSVAVVYDGPIAAGEALFSAAEAALLNRYGGLRPERDVLLFDPTHCYGLTGYLQIVDLLTTNGWPRSAFWPHGGHLFTLHVASALGLGGSEVNPLCFQPFGGLADGARVVNGRTAPPEAPGIGFETKADLLALFQSLHEARD